MAQDDELDALLRRIKRRRQSVNHFLKGARPRHVRLTNICILSSALACLLMAGPGIGGEAFVGEVADKLELSKAPRVWQPLCVLGALASLVAAVTANLSKSGDAESRIVSAEACGCELEGLEALVEFRQVTLEQGVKLYQQYLARIPFISDEHVGKGTTRKRKSTARGDTSV